MSGYVAGRAHFNGPLARILSPGSSALMDAVRSMSVVRTVRQLDAIWAGVARIVPAYESVLPLRPALTLTDEARTSAARGPRDAERLAAAASIELRAALVAAAADLGRRERRAVADVVTRASRRLGYSVQTGEGQRTTVVDARRDHHLMIIAVGDGGTVETEHAGLADDSWVDRYEVLASAMAALGVELVDIRRVGPDGRGGALIASAARHADDVLARGVVREHERADHG